MSTLKTTNLQHPSAVDPALVLDAAGGVVDVDGVPWGNKILQVVRATDTTNRSTTSTSFVDVTGLSVTITPTKSDSAILLGAFFNAETLRFSTNITTSAFQITDSSNNAISGAEEQQTRLEVTGVSSTIQKYDTYALFAYATPATTSAVTYKLRMRSFTSTSTTVRNGVNTGQLYAIEVSA